MNDDVGGYQEEHARTFGVGTLRPCPHRKILVLDSYGLWRVEGSRSWNSYQAVVAQPGDKIGTRRCLGCGNVVP